MADAEADTNVPPADAAAAAAPSGSSTAAAAAANEAQYGVKIYVGGLKKDGAYDVRHLNMLMSNCASH